MYEELIKQLQDFAASTPRDDDAQLAFNAIDAIEELSKILNKVNDAHNEGYDVGYWAGRRDYEPHWASVTERLPESGKHVLACCMVKLLNGKKRFYSCVSFYAAEKTITGTADLDDLELVYDEEKDEFYWPEGWYEVVHNWDEYGAVVIDDFVTHWMELPEAPEG